MENCQDNRIVLHATCVLGERRLLLVLLLRLCASRSAPPASGPQLVLFLAQIVRQEHPPISRKNKRLRPPAYLVAKELSQIRKGRARALRVSQVTGATLLEQPNPKPVRNALWEHPAAIKSV